MGIIRTTLLTGIYGVTGGVASVGAGMAYLAATTSFLDLTKNDPMFKTKTYAKYNPKGNPALQDVVIKRIPLRKIRPELRDNEEALTLEFCRGIWSRWGAINIFLSFIDFRSTRDLTNTQHRLLGPEQAPRAL